MSKRKLNKQQRIRIAQNQAQVADSSNLLQGLVVTHYGKEVEVLMLDASGNIMEYTPQRCHFRAKLPTIVCGDRVLWQAAPEGEATGVIEALQERRTLLNRPRPYEDPKPVAANIDLIVVTLAPSPVPVTRLIDRFLIAAENAGIEACVLINKQDLLASGTGIGEENGIGEEIEQLAEVYSELGYAVYSFCATSDFEAEHNKVFLDAIRNRTSILVGQSGVGKSSIINALDSRQQAKTGEVSAANERGRHTTTTSQLYLLDAIHQGSEPGTAIIDSPGIREFGLWHLSANDIINGMPEFQRYALQCKFRDCEHGKSKGCALHAAIDDGKIHRSRVSSYYQILDSLEE